MHLSKLRLFTEAIALRTIFRRNFKNYLQEFRDYYYANVI